MRTHALFLLLFLAVTVRADEHEQQIYLKKCCGKFEMLSGDGRSCVQAGWPQNVSVPFRGNSYTLPPLDGEWVGRWLPPGIPLKNIKKVSFNNEVILEKLLNIMNVNSSSVWHEKISPNEDLWNYQVVFYDKFDIVRPRPEGGIRQSQTYCVDAVMPPLGPFALRFVTKCTEKECARKCCSIGEVLDQINGTWKCEKDARDSWSPDKSSFVEGIDPEFPFSVYLPCDHLRLAHPAERSPEVSLSSGGRRFFSLWRPCFDFHRNNNTLKERFFICDYPRVVRGVYWLLRPLCVVSTLLLAVSLLSIACNKSMRRKIHGWCLAHHAACLFAFDLGQVVYYASLSDTIDDDSNQDVPADLRAVCTKFGLFMYFLLTAAWFWLTAVCANMALGFKLQVMSSRRSGRKRFLVFSSLAWGLPALLTATYSHLFTPSEFGSMSMEKMPWYSPQLMETRVCYSEAVFMTLDENYNIHIITLKYGTALIYYFPMGCLVVCNCVCLVHTLWNMQKLRRGNSILRKDEQGARGHRPAGKNTPQTAANIERGNEQTCKSRSGGGRPATVDVKTIKVYIKMLLLTGVIEITTEATFWVFAKYSQKEFYDKKDWPLRYRAAGYVMDFLRAVCVTWLAAPEGGYMAVVFRRGTKEKK